MRLRAFSRLVRAVEGRRLVVPKRDKVSSDFFARLSALRLLAGTLGFLSALTAIGGDLDAPLTSIAHVLSFSPEESAKSYPVRVRAIVSFSDPERQILYVQDSSAGISIRLGNTQPGMKTDYKQGQVLEIEGVTMRSRVQTAIRAQSLKFLGEGSLPLAYNLDRGELLTDRAESRLVRVKGWIPAVNRFGTRLNLELVVRPGETLELIVLDGDAPEARDLPGAQVQVTGVFRSILDSQGKKAGGRVYVSGLTGVKQLRLMPISSIQEAVRSASISLVEPLRFRATVATHNLGEFVQVRDGSGALRVPYGGLTYYNPGTLVEVFAFASSAKPGLSLTNVSIRRVVANAAAEEPAAAVITPAAANPKLATLTQVAQVRRLPAQEAARGYPVRLSGVLTFCDPAAYMQFLQDDTGGIYVDVGKMGTRPALRAGQRISVQGFSGPGDYAPIAIAQEIGLEGNAPFPVAEPVTFRKLMSGDTDSQWVTLKGVVRNQWTVTNVTTLALFTGDGVLKVNVREPLRSGVPQTLIDAVVQVRGVCTTTSDERRRLQSVELQVPGWNEVQVVEPAVSDAFALPFKAVSELFQFQHGASQLHRTHLIGVVVMQRRDGSFYLQDATGGIRVDPQTPVNLPLGTAVEVTGFPVPVDRHVALQDAMARRVKGGTPLEPADLKPEAALDESLNGTLVRLQGQVLGYFSRANEELLTLRFGQHTADVLLEKDEHRDMLDHMVAGSTVRLTGVCLVSSDDSGKPVVFQLLLRSSQDLQVISRPPWWTLKHTLLAIAGILTVLLLVLGWASVLREQVRQRTSELHQEIQQHQATELKLAAEIVERKRMESEVEKTHEELMIASRQAGMAEVATSVLHNVGNVLNSVNVSANLMADRLLASRAASLGQVAGLLKAHEQNLPAFFAETKGKQLPRFVALLASSLEEERKTILGELDSLRKHIEHIKQIVAMQQSYARVIGVTERVRPADLVEDALRIHAESLARHDIQVSREAEGSLPDLVLDKHKALQVLVNLVGNAKKACIKARQPDKRIVLRIAHGADVIRISVADNGIGIPAENLKRIFNHGFTTWEGGHGFGLHSGALFAKELGGTLQVESQGEGKGAVFTLELPLPKVGAADTAQDSHDKCGRTIDPAEEKQEAAAAKSMATRQ